MGEYLQVLFLIPVARTVSLWKAKPRYGNDLLEIFLCGRTSICL
jgi:hypothetical protein